MSRKGYCFAIPNLPDPITHPFAARKVVRILKALDGLTAIKPLPQGTLLFFADRTRAVLARNEIESYGNRCGRYIMECDVADDWSDVTVQGPAEWTGRE